MSILSRLFGGSSGSKTEAEPESFQDFAIYAEPERAEGSYRIAARIEKDIGGELKSHRMIRADTCNSLDEARELSIAKAKMLIEQQGETIFG